jgi:membrane protein YqaA with SNARE-associated domain
MKRVVEWVQGLALALGGPGLFLLAFLDSSFLTFPEIVDIVMMGLVVRHKERMIYYALMATIGSIAGCFALYWVARKGGETFLRKRFKDRHVDRALAVFQKYGLLAVAVPAILPPPVPFKVFVLAAGVARVRPLEFLVAVAIGRGVRYFGEALLAVWYGDRAVAFLHDNARVISIVVAAIVMAFGIVWTIGIRKGRRPPIDANSGRPL